MTDESTPRTVRYRDVDPRARRRTRAIVAVIAAIILVVLVVVADLAARAWAEQRVASEIENRLPETVDGGVDVNIGGFSVIAQYLTGRMDEVQLQSRDLSVAGVPVDADVDLRGVPVDTSQPVESVDGRLRLSEDAVGALLADQGVPGRLTLGDDAVDYSTEAELFGQSFTVSFTASAVLESGAVNFIPEKLTVDGAGGALDLSEVLPLVAPDGLGICLAEYVPEPVTLEAVTISQGVAVLDLSARDLILDSETFASTGSCA